MFYRYKVVSKKKRFRKFVVPVMLIAAALYFGNRYKHYLQFWKYSSNKLSKRIEDAYSMKDAERRHDALQQLAADVDRNKERNQTDSDAFLISGKVHYYIGESYLPGSFSELVINGKSKSIAASARGEFIKVLKDIKKAVGYLHGGRIPMEYSLILAKACFFTDFLSPGEIINLILVSGGPEGISAVEDIRFYAFLGVSCGQEDQSLKFLLDRGKVTESIQGKLFLATSETIAKRYTNSIIHYGDVLKGTDDAGIRKLVYGKLGEIYYTQSLFRESLSHFTSASEIDQKDPQMKIWIGKNYFSLGEKDKAKAVWSEVLAGDKANAEVKKLLGVM